MRGMRGFRRRYGFRSGTCYTRGSERQFAVNYDQESNQNQTQPGQSNYRGRDNRTSNPDKIIEIVQQIDNRRHQETESFEIFAMSEQKSSELRMITDTGATVSVFGEKVS